MRNVVAIFLILVIKVYAVECYGQNLNGLSFSNYSGINGVVINPASLSKNLIAFSFEPFSVNADLNQNVFKTSTNLWGIIGQGNYVNDLGIFFQNLQPFSKTFNYNPIEYEEAKSRLFSGINFGGPAVASFNVNVRGPSIMFSVGQKTGIAITTSAVSIINLLDNFSGNLLSNFDEIAQQNTLRTESLFRVYRLLNSKTSSHQYLQIGFHIGTAIYETDKHTLKGGIAIKRAIGLFAHSLYTENFSFQINRLSNRADILLSGTADYKGYNFQQVLNSAPNTLKGNFNYVYDGLYGLNSRSSGWGFDIGFEYEIKERNHTNTFLNDRSERLEDYSKKNYKLKISTSIVDIGGITYRSSPSNADITSYVFSTPEGGRVNASVQDFIDDSNENEEEIDEEAISLESLNSEELGLSFSGQQVSSFHMRLPTRLFLNLDYKLTNHVYLNYGLLFNLVRKNVHGARYTDFMALVPRYESEKYDISIPLSYGFTSRLFRFGLAYRWRSIYIGSDDILFAFSRFSSMNIYFGTRFALTKRQPKKYSNYKRKAYSIPNTTTLSSDTETDYIQSTFTKDEKMLYNNFKNKEHKVVNSSKKVTKSQEYKNYIDPSDRLIKSPKSKKLNYSSKPFIKAKGLKQFDNSSERVIKKKKQDFVFPEIE